MSDMRKINLYCYQIMQFIDQLELKLIRFQSDQIKCLKKNPKN